MSCSKVTLLGSLVLAAAACASSRRSGVAAPASAATAPATAAAAPAPPPATDNPALNLPIAARSEPLPPNGYPIFVTANSLLIGSPPVTVLQLPNAEERGQFGFGKAYKDSALAGYVLPLGKAMSQRACGSGGRVSPSAVIYMDANMQYRVFIDLLYTLSLLGYSEVFLATRASLAAPANATTRGVRIRARLTASHRVELTPKGWSLYAQDGGPFGPSCAAVTPERGQPPPVLSLTQVSACANQLVGTTGNLHLVAAADMPLQAIVPALVELGGERPVTPAFPFPAKKPNQTAAEAGSNATAIGAVSNAALVVASLRDAFTSCYRQELAVARGREGKLRLTLRIDAAGNVSEATIEPQGDLELTAACVKTVALGAKFAPPDGGSAVIAVPITFVNQAKELDGPKPPCAASAR